MPAQSKRPSPPARMVELLAVEKRALLALGVELTEAHFEAAWEACWAQMVAERAWAHATVHRRSSRLAMLGTKPEYCACFCDRPSGFQRYVARLAEAMAGAEVDGLDDGVMTGQLVA